jgi:hypothetical protein
MAKRLSRSNEEKTAYEINYTHTLLTNALYQSFKDKNFLLMNNIIARTKGEIDDIMYMQIKEIDRYTSLDLMSSVEARFRIDFYNRCENKRKDKLSQEFRKVYKLNKGRNIRFYDDILSIWIKFWPEKNKYLPKLKICFYIGIGLLMVCIGN